MPRWVANLPNLIQTSSAVNTSTSASPNDRWVDLQDASRISFVVSGVTSAPGTHPQVAFTSESTATFYDYVFISSGGTNAFVTSSAAVTIEWGGFKQMQFATSNVLTTGYTIIGSKVFDL